MRHTLVAESMGEGHRGLFEIHYLANNAPRTPIPVAQDMSRKWAERFVFAYNSQLDMLELTQAALAALTQKKTYPADIAAATTWLKDAIALATSPPNRKDTTPCTK